MLPFTIQDDSHVAQSSTPLLLFSFFAEVNGNSSLCVKFAPWKKKECCRAHVPSGPFKDAFKVKRTHSQPCIHAPPPPTWHLPPPTLSKEFSRKEVACGNLLPASSSGKERRRRRRSRKAAVVAAPFLLISHQVEPKLARRLFVASLNPSFCIRAKQSGRGRGRRDGT